MVKWSNYLKLETYWSASGTGKLQAGSRRASQPRSSGMCVSSPPQAGGPGGTLGPVKPTTKRGEATPFLSLVKEREGNGAEPGHGQVAGWMWEGKRQRWVLVRSRTGFLGMTSIGASICRTGDSCVPQDLKSWTLLGFSPNVRPWVQAGMSRFGSTCLIGDSPTSAPENASRSEGTFTYDYRISFNQMR